MTTTYTVPGISCGHCRQTIETGLRPVEGVIDVTVDVDAKTVTVEGTAAKATIRHQLDELGYPATG